tara:strand:- start:57 stop:227 length:171 start_codon:yes stop_codon:yes gene_type:complete
MAIGPKRGYKKIAKKASGIAKKAKSAKAKAKKNLAKRKQKSTLSQAMDHLMGKRWN